MKSSVVPSKTRRTKLIGLLNVGTALFLLFFILAFCSHGNAAQATLAWDAVTQPGLSEVYYGTRSRNYPLRYDVGTTTTLPMPDLLAGQTCSVAATARDTSGLEGDYS